MFYNIAVDNFIVPPYRKPTFLGLYLSWDAFATKSRKVNLIKCLTFRIIFSFSILQMYLDICRLTNNSNLLKIPSENIIITSRRYLEISDCINFVSHFAIHVLVST